MRISNKAWIAAAAAVFLGLAVIRTPKPDGVSDYHAYTEVGADPFYGARFSLTLPAADAFEQACAAHGTWREGPAKRIHDLPEQPWWTVKEAKEPRFVEWCKE